MILFKVSSKSSIYVRLLFSIAVLCLLSTFGSCSDDDDPAEIIPNPDSEIYFTKSLDFTSDSGEAILSFTTNKDWVIDVSQSGGDVSWCTVFPNKGKAGENQVLVKVIENAGFDDRNVTLVLTAKELTNRIVVTQKQKDAITLTTAKFEVDKNGGDIQVEVKANVSYEVIVPEQYQSWIHKRTIRPDKCVFGIDKSEEYDKREGEIIFRSGELEEILKVYQTGEGILLLTKNEYIVSDKGEQIAVELNSNFDFDVKMPQVDWITTTVTRNVSSHTLYYTVAPNDTYDKRETEIIYYDRNNKSLADTLRIIQVQKDILELKLETAGSLKKEIEKLNIDYLELKKLVLKGDINGSDIKLIREMAGVDYREKETIGILEYLDLSRTNIVEGGEIYCLPEHPIYESGYAKNNVIGDCMFRKCKSLKEILLPYSCVKIEDSSFEDCDNLVNVKLFDNITAIGNGCFNSCPLLQKINLPNSIKTIGVCAFQLCQSLEYIDLPNGINTLYRGLFFNCPSLKEIVIPESVIHIENFVFGLCSSLKSINIPDNVQLIEYGVFDDCTSIEKVIIGSGLIRSASFGGFINAREIHCRSTTPPNCYFSNTVYSNATLYVPKGCYEVYYTAANWRNFKAIVEE
ncbi:MAG: hypothetical protein EGR83_12350 [Bacteroides cellulosilyticus]|nr:hypothetical protein [Bacteroides cellulosilyticus]